MEEPVLFTIDSERRKIFDWQEIWRFRELFYFFTWRDIKVKYKQTVLGFLWAILQPLLMMLIFTFFFGRALNIPSQNLPYPVYVFSGLLMWNIFSTGLSSAANSMVSNAQIIKKIYFPKLIIPVSSIFVSVFDFLMAFVLFIGLLIFYGQPVTVLTLIYWPLAIGITVLTTMGLGCWLASLNVKYRDFRYVIPFLVQVLFFIAPVIYPLSIIKYPVLQYVLSAFPMYAAIEFFRTPLTGNSLNITFIAISLSSCIVILIIGVVYFKRTEDFFADFA